jgi:hypothetical protein
LFFDLNNRKSINLFFCCISFNSILYGDKNIKKDFYDIWINKEWRDFAMALFKILLIILFPCILTIIIILKMGAHFKNLYTEKEKQTRREKLLPYL